MTLREETAIRQAVAAYLHCNDMILAADPDKRPTYRGLTADQILAEHGIRFPSEAWRRCEAEIVRRARELLGAPGRHGHRNRTAKRVT